MGKRKFDVSTEDINFESYDDMKPTLQFMRMILLILLIIVMVGTLAVFSVGVMTHEVKYGSKQIADLIGVDMYRVDSIMMITAGAFSFLITILGVVAVVLRNRCLLGLHLVLLAFVSVMLFVGGVLGYIFISEMENTVEATFETTLKEKYGVDTENNGDNKDITAAWDKVQSTFECCGAYGDANATTSWAIFKLHSAWYLENYANGSLVPRSCCDPKGDVTLCSGIHGVNVTGPPYQGPLVFEMNSNYTLYTDGCYNKLKPYLLQNGILIGTVAIVVAVFMIVEMVVSILYHRKMKLL